VEAKSKPLTNLLVTVDLKRNLHIGDRNVVIQSLIRRCVMRKTKDFLQIARIGGGSRLGRVQAEPKRSKAQVMARCRSQLYVEVRNAR
jgi:hypothetical protein